MDIPNQLERIAATDDFAARSAQLTADWSSGGVSHEAIEPVLRFMEEHPEIDYGTPGPLVHFLERFYKKGYEEQLLLSVHRKPTCHTIWMLNRLINGTELTGQRTQLIAAMTSVKHHPLADSVAIEVADDFLGCLEIP